MNPEDKTVLEGNKDSEGELREQLERQSPVTAPRVADAIRQGLGDRRMQQYEMEESRGPSPLRLAQ